MSYGNGNPGPVMILIFYLKIVESILWFGLVYGV